MTLSLPGRTVVFDYGEVISRSPAESFRQRLEEIAGVDPAPFWESYGRNRGPLDGGDLSVVEYWQAVARDSGATWSLSTIHRLWAVDFPSWIDPEPGTVDIIEELHDGGTRLAILSNAGFDFASPLRHSPVASLFERAFVSAELHDLKPSASIYRAVLDGLGITPDEMVFIDNKRENVEGAEALGITGHVFTTPALLREFLVSLGAE